MSIRHALIDTVLGEITLVAAADALTGLYFEGHWTLPAEPAFGSRMDAAQDPVLGPAQHQLDEYLAGQRTSFDLPLATQGTELETKVWALLRELPFGSTTNYGQLAEQLGNKQLAQAVGRAVGHNPISIFIGCHRVIGSDGSLTGYAGGLARKQALLELENPEIAAGRLF
ncbi:methylated-DNA--[protein]-cysteine S-methyltransferase [Arthrobacter russicus]|jgi:methylated-DNA-[protein]-cysteine S-methyltransferase|uniref:Methylated-DNA--protein-cysteine methyltransferase n=1 Tax=Arthrobacter russicus TaxID=172040 RepID=A0ABU1JCF3_9MICC|nr:methylated-DNA--[protein]-cysteine S-methyltransferase [Arthrobacter russicus]MDN5668777.1 methylated-DNA--[protein]-cysteine S-methyltransferase [Renibacterium salmoninarum]MDR6269566.1 methylated-DNA-[protein]-cysteine S-methyltransferase [Arthrobacter russicus]